MYFSMYEGIKRYIDCEPNSLASIATILMAGGIAGICNWTVAIPFDTLKTRLQSLPASEAKLSLVLPALIRDGGIRGLYKGLGPTLVRAFPASAAFFGGVELCTALLDRTSS